MRGIYALYWEDQGLVYIGQGEPNTRYIKHISDAKHQKHYNYKVQEAYNSFGKPELVVLNEKPDDINSEEILWIKEFNSTQEGLNILPGGKQMVGLNHPRSKFSKLTILKVFILLSRTNMTYKNISERLGTTIGNIRSIASGRTHSWLKEQYPEEFDKMLKIRKIKITNILSSKKIYPALEGPDGTRYTITNIAKFCREHPLLSANWECEKTEIGRLFKGTRQVHKGFKLAK